MAATAKREQAGVTGVRPVNEIEPNANADVGGLSKQMLRKTFLAFGNPVWRRNRNAPSSLWLTVLSATAIAMWAWSLPGRFNGAMWSTMQPGQAPVVFPVCGVTLILPLNWRISTTPRVGERAAPVED